MVKARSGSIALYDSGRGVESVLQQCKRLLPDERWLVLQDVNNQPYGCKGPQAIIDAGFACFEQLMQDNIKAVVVACHTSSAIALPYLKKYFSVPMVGMLHPTAQLLATRYTNADIFWLATPASIHADRLLPLARKYGYKGVLHRISCPDWVAAIESGCTLAQQRIIATFIHEYGAKLRTGQYRILYGCTHYPLLDKWLQEAWDWPNLCIDPAEAVAFALQEMLLQKQLVAPSRLGKRDAVVSYIESSSLFLKRMCAPLVTT